MSFSLIFAILAGAFILFIAIYATLNIVRGGQQTSNVLCAKQFSLLFNPMETGMASGKSVNVSLAIETRIYNKCNNEGSFGSEEIACSQKSGMVQEWPVKSGSIQVNNKYVFSDEVEQGKNFYFFSMPFETGFKVSEIIVMTSKQYCFESAPEFIKEDVTNLQLGNIKLENCTGKETKVCFNSECDISVYGVCSGINCENEYSIGRTRKNGKTVYFADNLIYASIFSEPNAYLCNFKRLMQRIQNIAYLYNDEQGFLATRGCGSAMSSSLTSLASAAGQAQGDTLTGVENLKEAAERVESENNKQGGCRIYGYG